MLQRLPLAFLGLGLMKAGIVAGQEDGGTEGTSLPPCTRDCITETTWVTETTTVTSTNLWTETETTTYVAPEVTAPAILASCTITVSDICGPPVTTTIYSCPEECEIPWTMTELDTCTQTVTEFICTTTTEIETTTTTPTVTPVTTPTTTVCEAPVVTETVCETEPNTCPCPEPICPAGAGCECPVDPCDECEEQHECQACDNCALCPDCPQCECCDSCEDCEQCPQCVKCTCPPPPPPGECQTCEKCTNCPDCEKCNCCEACTDCSECPQCPQCDCCDGCTDCKDCPQCPPCEKGPCQVNCETCTDCTGCPDCEQCKCCDTCEDCNTCPQCQQCPDPCKTCIDPDCVACPDCEVCKDPCKTCIDPDCTVCPDCEVCKDPCKTCIDPDCEACPDCEVCKDPCKTCVDPDCTACPDCPQCDCSACVNCNDCQHCENCKDMTCSNEGVNWAFWQVPAVWGSEKGTYFSQEFDTDYLKSYSPELTGTWEQQVFPIAANCDDEDGNTSLDNTITLMGETVVCSYFGIQFRGYIFANIAGDYTFTGGPDTDDNTIVWAGSPAVYYTRAEAIVDIRFPDVATYTGTYTAQLGEYIPIRIICGQKTRTFTCNVDIKGPAGDAVTLLHTPCDESKAVQFPPWGAET
ncbi:hypothetical protein EDB81DRAFT_906312 [Dactylonectria macrodidyma]|uniref:GLEYA adhesin domain-containing protein n=1 Tax=Dactylonectria macrodidyma TaxID=307937 RepID=A0A9P9E4E0_9HYPO|nr:hypothetical protein EDB81DRAFT_906312 [Dactylonectria macrodidyma]